jgi:hypothetical protein
MKKMYHYAKKALSKYVMKKYFSQKSFFESHDVEGIYDAAELLPKNSYTMAM